MGQFLMQTAPGVDEYVLWSTGSDSPIACGDEAEMRRILRDMAIEDALRQFDAGIDHRFFRARRYGSDSGMRNGWWDDEEIRFRNTEGFVPRDKVWQFAQGYLALFGPREPDLPAALQEMVRPWSAEGDE